MWWFVIGMQTGTRNRQKITQELEFSNLRRKRSTISAINLYHTKPCNRSAVIHHVTVTIHVTMNPSPNDCNSQYYSNNSQGMLKTPLKPPLQIQMYFLC